MDYFNLSSELAKAKEPAFKSGMLKRYAKGGFTGRSEYKRSIENDIRVGMYAEGGLEGPIPNPNPIPPVYDIRAHSNPVEMMYGSAYTPIDTAKRELEKQFILNRGMAPVIPSTGKLNLQAAPQVGRYNVVRDAQGNIIQPSLSVMEEGGPIRPIYTSNPNDPRLQRYNDSLFAYNQGNADVTNLKLSLSRTADAHNKNKYFWENPYSPIYEEVRLTNSEREKIGPRIRGLIPETGIIGLTVPKNDTYLENLINSYASPTRGGKDARYTYKYKKPVQPILYSPNNNTVNTSTSKPKPIPKPKPPFVPDPAIVEKQQKLINAGFNIGKADGIWGPKSEEAWKKYEEASKPKPAPVVNKPTTTPAPRAEIIKDERYYLPKNQAPVLPSGKMNPQVYRGSGNTAGIETDASGNPIMANGGLKSYAKGGLIKRADGSYSRRGLWDNIRANRGSGKKPTKQMLEQEKKIKAKTKYEEGGTSSSSLQLFGKGGYRVSRTSERKGKTHKVTGPDGSVKYFGDPSMGERSKSKYGKDAFYKRHAKSLKKNPHFRAYAKATWSDGGLVSENDLFNLSSY